MGPLSPHASLFLFSPSLISIILGDGMKMQGYNGSQFPSLSLPSCLFLSLLSSPPFPYLYHLGDGMKMQGYNGSQLWDTAFWAQAVAESGLGGQFVSSIKKLNHYLDITQVLLRSSDPLSPSLPPCPRHFPSHAPTPPPPTTTTPSPPPL